MKIKILVLALIVFAFSLIPFKAEAVDSSASFGVDYMSRYVWRGTQLSDDTAVYQPSVEGTYGPVTANIWANYDHDQSVITETDYTLSYSHSIDEVSVDVGFIYYSFGSGAGAYTSEFYVSAGYDTLLSPSVTYYQVIDENAGGAFMVASISHDQELTDGVVVSLGASASLNLDNAVSMGRNVDGDSFMGLYNAEVSASLPYALPIDENIVITPMIAYSFALSDDAKNAIESFDDPSDPNSGVFYGGIGVSVGF